LRRTGVGALTLDRAVTLEALEAMEPSARDASLAPVDALLSTFTPVALGPDDARRFQQGQRLRLADRSTMADASVADATRVRVYRAEDGALLGVARFVDGVLAPERLVAPPV
jgi:tRNA pseudouridine55 synthase